MNLTDAEEQIEETNRFKQTGKKETKESKNWKAKWIYCEKAVLRLFITNKKIKKVHSTAFMLRVLTNSVIDTTANDEGKNGQFTFKIYL